MATEKFSNNASTTLNGAILDTSQSLVVASASGFPSSPQFRIKIDNEILLVTGVSGTTYTVARGQEGTSGVGHADGATVTHVLTAGALTQFQADSVQQVQIANGWTVEYDVDFTTLAYQVFSVNDTDVTIDGKTWHVNRISYATKMALNALDSTGDGTGLGLQHNTTAAYWDPGHANQSPCYTIPLTNIIPDLRTDESVRVTIWFTNNVTRNWEDFFLAIIANGNEFNHSFYHARGFADSTGNHQFQSGGNYAGTQTWLSQNNNTSDDVMVLEIASLAGKHSRNYTGVYNSGWPSWSNMRARAPIELGVPSTGVSGGYLVTPADAILKLTSQTANTSGTLRWAIKRLRIERQRNTGASLSGDVTGTTTSCTVAKIQGTALDPAMSAVSLNDVLTWDGSKWTHSSSAPITTRYTQPNLTGTLINWRLNELSTPWTNTGTAGTLNLTALSGTPVASGGLFDSSLLFSGSPLTTGDTSVGELSSTSISMSAWVLLTAYTSYANIVTKNYHSGGGFTAPYSSISIQCDSAGSGLQSPISTVGGSNPQYSGSTLGVIPLGVWTLLSVTYDGAHFVGYINGNVSSSLAVTGAIDWGTHGPWTIGGNGASARTVSGSIEDVRIESVVRSQAYYREMYKKGVGLFDTLSYPTLTRSTPTDSDTILNWKFDETSGTTFTDSKLGVALTPAVGASTISSSLGFFNRAVAMSSAALATGGGFGTGGSPSVNTNEPPATACTISAWVFQRSASGGVCIFRKMYYSDGSWAAPNLGGIDLSLNGSKLFSIITIGGSLNIVDTGKSIVVGAWQHIANVYDGATLKSYINGQLVYSRPVTGSMDFGNHGPWVVGGDPGGENFDGFIEDARVEGVARSSDYIWALYRNGVGLFDQYQSGQDVLVSTTVNMTVPVGQNTLVAVGSLSAPITVTLPASPTTGQTVKVKDASGTVGTYNVTVAGNGKTLDGSATFVMVQNYSGYEFIYSGTSWMVF